MSNRVVVTTHQKLSKMPSLHDHEPTAAFGVAIASPSKANMSGPTQAFGRPENRVTSFLGDRPRAPPHVITHRLCSWHTSLGLPVDIHAVGARQTCLHKLHPQGLAMTRAHKGGPQEDQSADTSHTDQCLQCWQVLALGACGGAKV